MNICPYCKEEGNKSKLFESMSASTCMYSSPFYDEDGIYHNHDPNILTTDYKCSNGHIFIVRAKIKCPNCKFGSEQPEIFKVK